MAGRLAEAPGLIDALAERLASVATVRAAAAAGGDDLVPRRERGGHRAADRAGRAGDGHAHQLIEARSTVGCSAGRSSSPLSATAATAAATWRATSRLNTLGMM